MNNTTNSWEEFKKKICTCNKQWLDDDSHYANCPIFELSTLLHDTEIAARNEGMRENAIKIDEFFADGILHGTDEASKMVRETIIAQAKKIAREEIKKEIDLALTQVHGGGNGRRLLEQLRDTLSH